jgi:hypothetical protein
MFTIFRCGMLVALTGIALLFLPMFGVPVNFLARFGSNGQAVGIGIIVVGGALAFMGMRRDE